MIYIPGMQSPRVVEVPVVHATRENTAEYGVFIGTDVPAAGLAIPFYKGAVEEGFNLPFVYHEQAVIRTGTWHDFPMAIDRPVTVLTANSAEVVEALATQALAEEMDRGDVRKIDILRHTGCVLEVTF